MTKNENVLAKYDLSSVKSIFTGAAPLGKETAEDLQKIYPTWAIRQGYGMYPRSMERIPANSTQDLLRLALLSVPLAKPMFGLDRLDLFCHLLSARLLQ